MLRHGTEDLEEHRNQQHDGDNRPDTKLTQNKQVVELVDEQADHPSEGALVTDGDRGPLAGVHLVADGAHSGKARSAQQVEGAKGNAGAHGREHARKRSPQARVGLGGVGDGQQRAGGSDDVLLGNKARDGQRGGLPGAKAKRGEDPSDQVAEHSEHGVVHELLGDTLHRGQEAKGAIVATEVGQEPHHDGGGEDNRTGLLDEGPAALPHVQRPGTNRREVVGRQLHDKRRGAAGKELGLLEHQTRTDDGEDAQEVEERRDPSSGIGGMTDDRAHEQGDDGQLGAAGDERGGHDRHAAVFLVLDGLGGHDAGDAAARGHEHGDEGLTGQTEAAEHAVHDESDASHIAAVLQEGQHHKEQEHLRHEAEDGTQASDDAVTDERIDQTTVLGAARHEGIVHHGGNAGDIGAILRRVNRIGVVARGLNGLIVGIAALTEHVPAIGTEELVVGEVGHRAAQGRDGNVVHAEHDDHKDRQAQDTVGNHAVDLLGGAHLGGGLGHALVDDVGDDAVALAGDDGLGVVVAILLALGD